MKIKSNNVRHVDGLSPTQWQVNLNLTPDGIPNDPATAFSPMSGKKRPCMHVKTNECDH